MKHVYDNCKFAALYVWKVCVTVYLCTVLESVSVVGMAWEVALLQ